MAAAFGDERRCAQGIGARCAEALVLKAPPDIDVECDPIPPQADTARRQRNACAAKREEPKASSCGGLLSGGEAQMQVGIRPLSAVHDFASHDHRVGRRLLLHMALTIHCGRSHRAMLKTGPQLELGWVRHPAGDRSAKKKKSASWQRSVNRLIFAKGH